MRKTIKVSFTLFICTVFLSLQSFAQVEIPSAINELLTKHTCFTCHKIDKKFIGPSWIDVSAKGMKKAELVAAVYAPNIDRWPGYPPMMAMPQVPKKEVEKIADWISKLKSKK